MDMEDYDLAADVLERVRKGRVMDERAANLEDPVASKRP
jgi:predicted DNA-binding protein